MTAVDEPSGNATQPQGAPTMPDQQPRWGDPIFRAGLLVGAALFAIGILCQTFNLIAPTISILVICSGLGIIFGAFGSTAVINYKGFVVAGVAAIAVALLLVVDFVMRESLVRIEVDGDVRGARLELFGDSAYPGADHDGRRFEFFIVGREITKDRLSLIVSLPPDDRERDGRADMREVVFDCIPATAITRFIGGGKTLQWRFDSGRELLTGLEGGPVRSGPCQDGGALGPNFAALEALSPIGPALADETAGIPFILADLESESAAVRRNARTALAEIGLPAVRPMLDYWIAHPGSYQVRLGVSVALTELLRNGRGDRKAVSAMLADDDLKLLAAAVADDDRTLRVYASEFLYDLGDPRIVPIAVRLFESAGEDGRYNLILVMGGAVPNLSEVDKAALRKTLQSWEALVGPNTDKLIASIVNEIGA
jgi:hypothetical protein